MVHHIYIYTNQNSSFVVQDCDRLEGNHHTPYSHVPLVVLFRKKEGIAGGSL
jgi:hypothetical protein